MENEIEITIRKLFSADDVNLIHIMLSVVEKDLSRAGRAKRLDEIEKMLRGVRK